MPTADELGVDDVLSIVKQIFGIEGREHGDEFQFLCLAHEDSNPSCSVNTDTGLWSCFSCRARGDLLGLGMLALRKPRSKIEELVRPTSPDALLAVAERRLRALRSAAKRSRAPTIPKRLPALGSYAPGPLTELRKRGLLRRTLQEFDVRYCSEETLVGKKGPFTIHNSIAIPVCDEKWRVLNWCYRSTSDSPTWQPRYLYYTEGLRTDWFGLNVCSDTKDIVVVEGPIDAMWVYQCGIPALAIMAASAANEEKAAKLLKYRSVTIFADNDKAGWMLAMSLGELLWDKVPTRVVRYPSGSGKDPNLLAGVDVELAVARAIPWMAWAMNGQASVSSKGD